jgi:hypothetical protein
VRYREAGTLEGPDENHAENRAYSGQLLLHADTIIVIKMEAHQQNTTKERFPLRCGDLFPLYSPAVKKVFCRTIAI